MISDRTSDDRTRFPREAHRDFYPERRCSSLEFLRSEIGQWLRGGASDLSSWKRLEQIGDLFHLSHLCRQLGCDGPLLRAGCRKALGRICSWPFRLARSVIKRAVKGGIVLFTFAVLILMHGRLPRRPDK
jgi:hypothetical protein